MNNAGTAMANRALQAFRYGTPAQALRLVEIAKPAPGTGQVLVRVHAAALNPIDYKLLGGALRRVQRLAFPVTLGFDGSGVIEALGPGVEGFALGQAVFFRASRDTLGAFADYCVQPAEYLALRPQTLSARQAASLPLVALTTVQALRDRAKAAPGQRILIHAGSGGLGSFAIQYARYLGLLVAATTSSRNADLVRELGAHEVICYDREEYRQRRDAFDIVFDTLGGTHTLDAFDCIKPGGVVVSVAGPPDRDFAAQVGAGWLLRLGMRLASRKVYGAARRKQARYFRFLTESNGAQLAEIAVLVEKGVIHAVIDRVFTLDNAVAAFEYLAAGHAKGKVVLDVAGDSSV